MNYSNGSMKVKNGSKGENYFIEMLIALVQEISPHESVKNPYRQTTKHLEQYLSESERTQYRKLIKTFTVLNQPEGKHTKESTREDVQNAWLLLLRNSQQLSAKQTEFLATIKDHFKEDYFSIIEASLKTRLSISSLKRRIYPLLRHGFLEKKEHKRKAYFRITHKSHLPEVAKEQTAFEIAFEEWEDYVGFVEL